MVDIINYNYFLLLSFEVNALTTLSSFAFPFKFFFVILVTRLVICESPKHLGLIDIFQKHTSATCDDGNKVILLCFLIVVIKYAPK